MRTCTAFRGATPFHLVLLGGLALVAACGDSKGSTGSDGSMMDGSTASDGANPSDALVPGDAGSDPSCRRNAVLPDLAFAVAADGLDHPVFVTQAPGNTNTLWVVEKRGVIKLVRNGAVLPTPFLDIASKVDYNGSSEGDERGLLGLAFHPNYATNGRFFVFYNPSSQALHTVVAEYGVSGNSDVANGAEVRQLLDFDDLGGRNHVGGMIAFGPDGRLYVGVGDGGGGDDNDVSHGPVGNGLNKNVVLGKLLRLDVDNMGGDYAAAGNPFSGASGDERIWAYGLRNPWRFSFSRYTGDLYIGDVGQDTVEEIDVAPKGEGGLNFGWRAFEGTHVHDGAEATQALATNHTPPVVEFPHGDDSDPLMRGACSVSGGYVYAGSALVDLQGAYLFSDYCSDDIAMFRYCDGTIRDKQRLSDLSRDANLDGVVSFGQDNDGEMYIVSYKNGTILKIVPGEG